jgi:hypothetical protein
MSIVEETSKVTQQAITALNSVPVLLALVLLQFFILGSVLYLSIVRDKNVHIRFLAMIERCVGVQPGQPLPPLTPLLRDNR